ncbi:nucleotide exchange factor GrpE [Usitatibacter palustris]|uniref:Protein GrpE n=1 Tax=Usitatibacter palustris TaxID=2732487 RepID=A0A6M4H9H5_9PROT|nr:nucleotide exchange factor GrpE [Usitatibacter palustris]QJR14697.1 Protein GrpE [Usitatibacter palustris]
MGEPAQTSTGETPEGVGIPDAGATAPNAQPDPLAEALAEAARLREEWLRAKAETENVRRRGQEDVSKAHKFGVEGMASALLGVKDGLEAALTVESSSLEAVRQGVELTARQLDAVFERFGLKPVAPAVGEKFDPHRHQAISAVPSEQEPNTVVALLQKGWLLHDRVLRPALVTVAAAPG